MKIAKIIMIMAVIVTAFSAYGIYSVPDDQMIRQFFFVYLITGGLLFIASIVEIFYQKKKMKNAPAPAKEQVMLPKDDTLE